MLLPLFAKGIGNSQTMAVPGVMAMDWIPMPGSSHVSTDPAAVAGKEIYAKVRNVYSGRLYADAPDYITYLLCLDSIYAYIAYLKRIYRVVSKWTGANYDLPDGLLHAMRIPHVVAEYIRQNKTRFWQNINELILQSNKFTCPALMDMLNRHYWMSDNVYTDANTISSQMYIFNLVGVHQFRTATESVATGTTVIGLPNLNWQYLSAPQTTDFVDALYQFGLTLIQKFVEWDDCYTINGYLTRAYEGTPNFMVAELAQDEALEPVYSEEVLSQIENSRTSNYGLDVINWLQSPKGTTTLGTTEDVMANYIITQDTLNIVPSREGEMDVVSPFVSIRADVPTVADVVIATRLQLDEQFRGASSGSDGDLTFTAYGTEIPLLWRLTMGTQSGARFQQTTVFPTYRLGFTDVTVNTLNEVGMVESFDWHPFYAIVGTGSDAASQSLLHGDIHNITVFSKDQLRQIHRVCVLSELNAFNF